MENIIKQLGSKISITITESQLNEAGLSLFRGEHLKVKSIAISNDLFGNDYIDYIHIMLCQDKLDHDLKRRKAGSKATYALPLREGDWFVDYYNSNNSFQSVYISSDINSAYEWDGGSLTVFFFSKNRVYDLDKMSVEQRRSLNNVFSNNRRQATYFLESIHDCKMVKVGKSINPIFRLSSINNEVKKIGEKYKIKSIIFNDVEKEALKYLGKYASKDERLKNKTEFFSIKRNKKIKTVSDVANLFC